MDINLFKSYLQDIQGRLTTPQSSALYEDIRDRHTGTVIDAVSNVLNENVRLAGDSKAGKKAAANLYQQEEAEQIVNEYLTSFFGGELNENISDEDIMEAVDVLNNICYTLDEYFQNENDVEPNDVVVECLNSLFDGGLTEDTSDQDIAEAVESLYSVANIINEFFTQETE